MKDCEIYTLNIAQFQEFLKILKKKIEHEGVTKIERSITTVVLWKLARLKQGLKAQLRFLLNNEDYCSSTLLYPSLFWAINSHYPQGSGSCCCKRAGSVEGLERLL